MGSESNSSSNDERDEENEDECEDVDGGNRFLGFMFGNVDNSGDLDVDYLDEDAKEHLAALADKLGPSLTDIHLSVKSRQTAGDTTEQDYDEKAEDAVDYEDIDEQYEGPEIHAASEEDYLLPKKEYFSARVSLDTQGTTDSVFDDENYDEDEEIPEELEDKVQPVSSSGEQGESLAIVSGGENYTKDQLNLGTIYAENSEGDIEECHEDDHAVLKASTDDRGYTQLPVLCIEDGMEILRFSEIFGIHEPLKKGEKRDFRFPLPKDRYKSPNASYVVEEDEEAFLKEPCQGFLFTKRTHIIQHDVSVFNDDYSEPKFGVLQDSPPLAWQSSEGKKDSCLNAEPMKDYSTADISKGGECSLGHEFYPVDQQDWEEKILWDNSPAASGNSKESCEVSGSDLEDFAIKENEPESRTHHDCSDRSMDSHGKCHTLLHRSPILLEAFGSNDSSGPRDFPLSASRYHPQLLRLESQVEDDNSIHPDGKKETGPDEVRQGESMARFSKLLLQNRDLEGSWLDKIIWDPDKPVVKPKLILDFQDNQMLFEILNKDSKHLKLHAGAMIITRSLKSSSGESIELPGHGNQAKWLSIGNDNFYSKRKSSQQHKSDSKKRTSHGVKVHHSIPALKLQTMKLKLCNKDLANFHRPKALWYPHDNEVAVKEQGKLPTQGPMKIILKSLGGKGSKLHVDAEENVSSVKEKASKKLDFKTSETVRIFYMGKELEDHKSLAAQNVRPNSLLHLIRTKIHLLPRAQKLPGENKSLRPPGAFKKKSDMSVKDGHVFVMEYCEERPLLLGNTGMGARLCTYYQKSDSRDQSGTLLSNGSGLGTVMALDPVDKSPFLGDIKGGCSQSSIETNMYRAPVFPHKVASTDYLLIRSAKGKLSIRRIDKINVVGQQEPLMEVMPPVLKVLQTYMLNRLFVYVCREFRALEKRGVLPCIRADELYTLFLKPNLTDQLIRKNLRDIATLQRDTRGLPFWVLKRNSRIPPEEQLRRKVLPEDVCAYESMQAGLYRLKHLGITMLTHPTGISSAMSQLPAEAVALAAASHIERELQITPWNLSANFVACTNQDRENIERLEITGVGDPSGRGLGFSYVRAATKAPISSAMVNKKTAAARGASTVTGTDADLRRLSMEAAREILLKFNVPEEVIAKNTRWHRIALIRKLSSEQAASGVKVDSTTISKYARGHRMSFLQLQQQTRDKCQEIWDKQLQSLSAVEGDENESESEANSDLDSFAGDLENLLDAEEFEETEIGSHESKYEKADGVNGLKMRRRPSRAQAEEEIEDEAAEAAELCRMLMDGDEAERKKKKKSRAMGEEVGLVPGLQSRFSLENVEQLKKSNTIMRKSSVMAHIDGSFTSKENISRDMKEVESLLAQRSMSRKVKTMKNNDGTVISVPNKRVKIVSEGVKIFKEKKSARERFVCGACGLVGHMRTNKNCPKYREDQETQLENTDLGKASGKSNSQDPFGQPQQKPLIKKLIPKGATKIALIEAPAAENSTKNPKVVPLKFKCSSSDMQSDKHAVGTAQSSDFPVTSDAETTNNYPVKVKKIKISSKKKLQDFQMESHKPSIVIRPPADSDIVHVDLHKPSVVIRPPTNTEGDQIESRKPSIVIRPPTETDREQPHKKIIIKRPKEMIDLDRVSQDGSTDFDCRKIKKIAELSSFERHGMHESSAKRKARDETRLWEEEEENRRNAQRFREERARWTYDENMIMLGEQERVDEIRRYEESIRREREEEEQQKAKKKKKKKHPEIRDEYLEDKRSRRNDRRLPERERIAKRRHVVELSSYGAESAPPTKRRRGGEVGLSNILEGIVDNLRERTEVSYLFLKPVSKKEAPDYLDYISTPMDLSTIKNKVRNMEYKHRDDFRSDVFLIAENAYKYNEGRNPGIPPLADKLLELCDDLLYLHDESLAESESAIEYRDL